LLYAGTLVDSGTDFGGKISCGIDSDKIEDTHSLGIVGMKERLSLYGGKLQIEGAPGKGTTARVVMPLQ
jgi:signal transduction histidine kinase